MILTYNTKFFNEQNMIEINFMELQMFSGEKKDGNFYDICGELWLNKYTQNSAYHFVWNESDPICFDACTINSNMKFWQMCKHVTLLWTLAINIPIQRNCCFCELFFIHLFRLHFHCYYY